MSAVDTYISSAKAALREESWHAASSAAKQGLAFAPNHVELLHLLGQALMGEAEFVGAVEVYTAFSAAEPGLHQGWESRAAAHSAAGQWAEAHKAAAQGLSLLSVDQQPEDAVGLYAVQAQALYMAGADHFRAAATSAVSGVAAAKAAIAAGTKKGKKVQLQGLACQLIGCAVLADGAVRALAGQASWEIPGASDVLLPVWLGVAHVESAQTGVQALLSACTQLVDCLAAGELDAAARSDMGTADAASWQQAVDTVQATRMVGAPAMLLRVVAAAAGLEILQHQAAASPTASANTQPLPITHWAFWLARDLGAHCPERPAGRAQFGGVAPGARWEAVASPDARASAHPQRAVSTPELVSILSDIVGVTGYVAPCYPWHQVWPSANSIAGKLRATLGDNLQLDEARAALALAAAVCCILPPGFGEASARVATTWMQPLGALLCPSSSSAASSSSSALASAADMCAMYETAQAGLTVAVKSAATCQHVCLAAATLVQAAAAVMCLALISTGKLNWAGAWADLQAAVTVLRVQPHAQPSSIRATHVRQLAQACCETGAAYLSRAGQAALHTVAAVVDEPVHYGWKSPERPCVGFVAALLGALVPEVVPASAAAAAPVEQPCAWLAAAIHACNQGMAEFSQPSGAAEDSQPLLVAEAAMATSVAAVVRGCAAWRLQDARGAIAAWAQAAEQAPCWSVPFLCLATAYAKAQDPARSWKFLKQAQALSPGIVPALAMLGMTRALSALAPKLGKVVLPALQEYGSRVQPALRGLLGRAYCVTLLSSPAQALHELAPAALTAAETQLQELLRELPVRAADTLLLRATLWHELARVYLSQQRVSAATRAISRALVLLQPADALALAEAGDAWLAAQGISGLHPPAPIVPPHSVVQSLSVHTWLTQLAVRAWRPDEAAMECAGVTPAQLAAVLLTAARVDMGAMRNDAACARFEQVAHMLSDTRHAVELGVSVQAATAWYYVAMQGVEDRALGQVVRACVRGIHAVLPACTMGGMLAEVRAGAWRRLSRLLMLSLRLCPPMWAYTATELHARCAPGPMRAAYDSILQGIAGALQAVPGAPTEVRLSSWAVWAASQALECAGAEDAVALCDLAEALWCAGLCAMPEQQAAVAGSSPHLHALLPYASPRAEALDAIGSAAQLAAGAFIKATSCAPQFPQAWLGLALCHPDEQVATLAIEHAVRLSNTPGAWLHAAAHFASIGDVESATEALARAQPLDPNNPALWLGKAALAAAGMRGLESHEDCSAIARDVAGACASACDLTLSANATVPAAAWRLGVGMPASLPPDYATASQWASSERVVESWAMTGAQQMQAELASATAAAASLRAARRISQERETGAPAACAWRAARGLPALATSGNAAHGTCASASRAWQAAVWTAYVAWCKAVRQPAVPWLWDDSVPANVSAHGGADGSAVLSSLAALRTAAAEALAWAEDKDAAWASVVQRSLRGVLSA